MKSPLITAITCFILISNSKLCFSQDTINLLNGRKIITRSIYDEPANALLKYDIIIRGKAKQKAVDKINIFSINYFDKTDRILYRQDTAIGFNLSITEMEYYILGEQEAIKNFKAPWITVGGFVFGATATNFVGFWGLLTPAVYGTVMGVIDPKIKLSDSTKVELKSNKNFVDGYMTTATRKKVKNAILGSVVGATVLAITSAIINAL